MYSEDPLDGLSVFFDLCIFLGNELQQLSILGLSF